MVGELTVSPIVPSLGSDLPAPPFAPQGPSGWFPCLIARTAALRPLVTPSDSFSLVQTFPARAGGDEVSQVPGQPLRTCPALRPRQSLSTRYYGASVLPSAFGTASASVTSSFVAASHGPHTRCPRFTSAVTCTYAGLASGWLPALSRRDYLPAGFLLEVSTIILIVSPSTRLVLAHSKLGFKN